MVGGYEVKTVINALDDLCDIDYVKKDQSLQKELSELKQVIEDDYFMVVVLGEFKRGKSSFINALLGMEILPTDVLPETATINMLAYSEKPGIQVVYKDGCVEKGEVSLSYLKHFSANSGNDLAEKVNYIKIGYPLDILKKRIVLVDTPGVADLDDMRTDVTYGFLPRANFVIFLLDANTPLTQTEKTFIEERIVPQGITDIMFIVNKYDCVDEEEDEDFLDDLMLRLNDVFKMETVDAKLGSITLFPLSAKMALQGIIRGDDSLLAASGLPDIINNLWEKLSEGAVTKGKENFAKVNLQKIAGDITKEIEKQIAVMQASIDELKMVEQALMEELSSSEEKRTVIDTYVLSIQDKILAICDKSIYTFGKRLKEEIGEQIELYQGTEFKDFIEKLIARRIQKSIENWIMLYTPHLNTLLKMMEREISIGLSREFNQNIQLKTNSCGELNTWGKALQLNAMDISNVGVRAGTIAAVGGIGLLAIAGSSIMPLISFAALPYLRSYMLKKKLAEVKQDVSPLISSQINKVIKQLQEEVHNYIINQCQAIKKNTDYAYNIILEQLRKELSLKIDEKRCQSTTNMQSIDKLQKDVERVNNIAVAVGGNNGYI